MDPRQNPFSPGAGTQPPELAGRDDILERASISLDRIKGGRAARSHIFYGLRGVGKTVLLKKIQIEAEAGGHSTIWIEAPEERSLPGLLVPAIRAGLLRLSRGEVIKARIGIALQVLASFASALKFKYQDITLGLDQKALQGIGDSGELELDLVDLLRAVGEAAQERKTSFVIFIDELQYVPEAQLAVLISALHQIGQENLPLTIVGAGLPQLLALTGRAKSYAERLFEFVLIDRLDEPAACIALSRPVEDEGAAIDDAAIQEILAQTEGYPYFLQEWGKHSWDLADESPIDGDDARRATVSALAELDASFFRVRFDRLTPAERDYMRAMAELGAGPHRSGDIAQALGKKVTTVAPLRNGLIQKGMIYSPGHGDTAFTVPLFDGFMKRVMPANGFG